VPPGHDHLWKERNFPLASRVGKAAGDRRRIHGGRWWHTVWEGIGGCTSMLIWPLCHPVVAPRHPAYLLLMSLHEYLDKSAGIAAESSISAVRQ